MNTGPALPSKSVFQAAVLRRSLARGRSSTCSRCSVSMRRSHLRREMDRRIRREFTLSSSRCSGPMAAGTGEPREPGRVSQQSGNGETRDVRGQLHGPRGDSRVEQSDGARSWGRDHVAGGPRCASTGVLRPCSCCAELRRENLLPERSIFLLPTRRAHARADFSLGPGPRRWDRSAGTASREGSLEAVV